MSLILEPKTEPQDRELAGLKVLLAHNDRDTLATLEAAVSELQHEVIEVCQTATQILARARKDPPDLIMTAVDLPDFDGVSALVELSRDVAIPSIVVTTRRTLDVVERALRDHVMAYLMEPIEKEEIKPTIYLVLKRFEQFQDLRQEVENLKQALDDRKLIERAKGMLMHRWDVDEEEAYRRLRRHATDGRIRLVDAARAVLDHDKRKAL